jgi:hypothetical protein
LNLLEGQADGGTDGRLAHAKQRATLTHARSDMDVHWMRLGHGRSSFLSKRLG